MKSTVTKQDLFTRNVNGFKGLNAIVLFCCLFFAACQKDVISDSPTPDEISEVKPDIIFYALTSDGLLNQYNANDPSMPLNKVKISGLQANEKLLAIDFRPSSGQLYGLGSSSRIYILNFQTGVARPIGTAPFSPALSGEITGFDFNPVVDRIRVVTSTGQNLRLNPETGTVAATDGAINGVANAMVSGVAYANNLAGAASTELFVIDIKSQKLYSQNPPNEGTLVEVGELKQKFGEEVGFDISPDGSALATLQDLKKSTLFLIDLKTAKASKIGDFKNCTVIGLAIPTNPVAYAVCKTNDLYIFNPVKPEPVIKPITGLQADEKIVGLDMRPVNGQLYALGNSSRLYTINAASGAATLVGTGPFSPALSGTYFGFDFNPTVDRIRVVSNNGQNLRLHPETGVVAFVDGNLNPGTPQVTAAAYSNNFAGALTTELFVMDTDTDMLFTQVPPNDGTLVGKGSLGLDAEASNGFDIGGTSGKAYAIIKAGGSNKIYQINLSTGMATGFSHFPASVSGFAVGLGF